MADPQQPDNVRENGAPLSRPVQEPEEDDVQPTGNCPVVAIGASAGGLEAVGYLLDNVPANTGMAFVVILHLARAHESQIAELLSSHTSMRVEQAAEGVTVQPNAVYIIPPNTRMAIRDGKLELTPRSDADAQPMPIDFFFSSLAAEQKARAVGVILSGGGADGSLGLEAIKGEGGVTFAQDGSAPHESMPRSAVLAGVVDFILSPREIGRELAFLGHHFHLGSRAGDSLIDDGPLFQKVLLSVREETGVDFTHYKSATIKRRLWRRMGIHHIDRLEDYLHLIEKTPGEVAVLYDDLLITVTDFFRDPSTFAAITEKIFPELTNNRKVGDIIRIWVAGCSLGKEVYSLAIALTEYMEQTGRRYPVQIFGTDISDKSIEIARQGKFPDTIASAISRERLNRFFIKLERGYQITRHIRDLCAFSRQDVTRDPPLARMDLVSCRNLLIYLGPVLQRRVLAVLGYALKPRGFLVLGNSETVVSLANQFHIVDAKHKIYARNPLETRPEIEIARTPEIRSSQFSHRASPLDNANSLDRRADWLLLEEYAPSGFILNDDLEIVKFRGNVGPYLAPAPGDAVFDVLRLVREDLVEPLRSCLAEARRTNLPVVKTEVHLRRNESSESIGLVVRPLTDDAITRHYLVLFESSEQRHRREGKSGITAYRGDDDDVQVLASELASTRRYMQGLVEELRSANEEAQSGNEELQSTNEELQTAKEELQSSNEELTTTNEEMQSRNRELGQVNNDLLNLLSSMQVPIVMLNRDMRIRRYTPVSNEVLNLLQTDVGRPITDLNLRIQVPDLAQILEQVVESKLPHEREVQNHQGRWYSMRIGPYKTSDNQIEGTVLQFVDIDPIRRTLEAVKHARDYAEAIFSSVREPLLVLDEKLCIQSVNDAFVQTFGIARENAVKHYLFEIGDGQWDEPKIRGLLNSLSEGQEPLSGELEIERELKSSGVRNFALSVRRVHQADRHPLLLLAMEDVTDRKRAAEAKYRRLFESAKDGILIVDGITGEITDANPYLLDLMGYSLPDLVGQRFSHALPLLDGGNAERAWDRIGREGVVRFSEVTIRARDSRRVETEIIANHYWEGEQPMVEFNLRDITERKRFEQQLLQTAKLESLGVLAGGIAHDFNNLLTGIMGNASLALSEAPAESSYQGSLKEVVLASQRAADLTGQMLAYAGKGRYVVRPINFSELVRDIGILVRSSVPKWVGLDLRLGEGQPPVQGDASQLQQVLMNLVINGAESIPPSRPGCVRVKTRVTQISPGEPNHHVPGQPLKPGSYLSLQVTDNGAGMERGVLQRIFDPFFSTKFTGRGLGLAAVQGIIRAHNGLIRVKSVVGRGTSFRVLLPVAKGQVAVPALSKVAFRDLRGTGLVLVVDDEPIVMQMAQKALVSHGYQVLTAENGEVAVRIVRERPDLNLMILDRTMPVMGGDEAFGKVREWNSDLPIIFSSGFDAVDAMQGVREGEPVSFIKKPYTAEALLRAVKTALGEGERGNSTVS